jgi:hypothetical protein
LEVLAAESLAALESSWLAQALRTSRWGYPILNIAHLLGIALLFGSIVPLDLRALGAWRHSELDTLSRVLVPTARAGLALAVATGFLLFCVRAGEYASMPLFWTKMGLLAVGTANALLVARYSQSAAPALVSILAWTSAIAAGRLLGYLSS